MLSVLLFLTQSAVYGQLNSRAVLSTSSLSRVVVSRLTGDVFLADGDTVYLLPGDLSEITSNVSRTAGQTPAGMTLSKQEDKLIVCWASAVQSGGETSNDAPCVVYNSTDLLQLQTLPANNLPVGAARGNPYLVSQGFGGGEGETFYAMSADDRRLFHRKYRISDGARAVDESILFADITGRRYVSGATVGNFSYFVTNTIEDGTTVVRVVRVCDIETTPGAMESLWDNWYEVQVVCGTTTGVLADFDNELANANFLFPSNGVEGPLLVVSVTSLSGAVVSYSTVCAVPLSAIDASARSMFDYCANNDVQLQFPWTNTGACISTVSVPACV